MKKSLKKEKKIVWKVEKRKISELKPHPKNPRNFTEKGLKDLENSINSIGFAQPININSDNTILSGHARLMKLEQMGEEEVDVYVPDRTLTPKQEDEVIIRMNANTAGQWDFEKLANEFELPELTEWGLDLPDIEELEPEETVGDDEVPDEPVKAITVRGDLYELGKHRLLCGDSTIIDDVEKLLNRVEIHLVYTDPPYGINEKTDRVENVKTFKKQGIAKKGQYDPIIGDDSIQTAIDVYNLIESFGIKKIVYWGGNYYANTLPNSACWLVWDKRVEDNQRDINSDCELAWIKHPSKKSVRIFRHLWKGMIKGSEQGQSRVHPTQKPIALAEYCFEEYLDKDEINVMDLFLGSGSTLIACEKTKRICYGMELSETYVDVCVKRYIQFCEANNIKPSVKRNGEDCLAEFKI